MQNQQNQQNQENHKESNYFIVAIVSLMISLLVLSASWVEAVDGPPAHYDILIKNGRVVDGTGKAGFIADIAVKNGKIIQIGKLNTASADQIINAKGMVVSPGFIDLHSHADHNILRNPDMENGIRQGITTVLSGNCGGSPLPIADFMTSVQQKRISVNLALLVGHNTIRKKVMGRDSRTPSLAEQAQMEALLEQAMKDGAFGLSTGLKYIPGAYSSTQEIVALAKIAAKYDGFYATHMREEGLDIVKSVAESLSIGRKAHLPVHISHHKIIGPTMWGSSLKTLNMLNEARAEGLDVSADQYPYTASSTTLSILFPAWSLAGGQTEILKRLADSKIRARVKAGIIDNIRFDRAGGDPARVTISSVPSDPTLAGKNLAEVTVLKGQGLSMVMALAFSPDGKLVASGSAAGTARIWDAIKG
ncbi:MAG: amidohydrolase family protein, partial [Psychrosphaera sp.]|nr:amidohydrolase family protein [Psychrosphaera sp.]